MIHYHGTPISGKVENAVRILRGRHAFISFAAPAHLPIAMDECQSFALDNGAYSVWRKGNASNWVDYYKWVEQTARHPGCDFAIIPDVIGGSEKENDTLLSEWPLGSVGIPVWHLHESVTRLAELAERFDRVALGSSGAWSTPGTTRWWGRMAEAMQVVCDGDGFPLTKLHGLRMLSVDVFPHLPLASADSTNVCQNMGLSWHGVYEPASAAMKGAVIAERIERLNSAAKWSEHFPLQQRLLA